MHQGWSEECRASWAKPGPQHVAVSSVMTTQVADWHEKARELMPITISPLQSIMGGAAHGGHVASRSGTSEGTDRDRDGNSKI